MSDKAATGKENTSHPGDYRTRDFFPLPVSALMGTHNPQPCSLLVPVSVPAEQIETHRLDIYHRARVPNPAKGTNLGGSLGTTFIITVGHSPSGQNAKLQKLVRYPATRKDVDFWWGRGWLGWGDRSSKSNIFIFSSPRLRCPDICQKRHLM